MKIAQGRLHLLNNHEIEARNDFRNVEIGFRQALSGVTEFLDVPARDQNGFIRSPRRNEIIKAGFQRENVVDGADFFRVTHLRKNKGVALFLEIRVGP